MALLNFDATQVEPNSFEAIPAGIYNAMIVSSEMRNTKDKTGEFLYLEFAVVDGEFKGRKLFARLNLKNRNQQAVEIAQADLSSICHAIGVLTPNDSCELHGIPMSVKVVCEKNSEGKIMNSIKKFMPKQNPANSFASDSGASPWSKKQN